VVRIIESTPTDLALPGCGEPQGLIITLLDPKQHAAIELICAYDERWKFELVIDEMDTHQRLPLALSAAASHWEYSCTCTGW
jgi:hypothetical protein